MNIYGDVKVKAKESVVQTYLKLLGKETPYIPLHAYEVTKSSTNGEIQAGDILFFTPEGKSIKRDMFSKELFESDYTPELLDFEVKDAEYYTVTSNSNGEYCLDMVSATEL